MSGESDPPDDESIIRVPGTDRVFHRGRMLVVLLSILAMTMMAISAINVALPSIESSLGASNSDVQWMLSGYALAFGMAMITRYDVDWVRHGYDDEALHELVEHSLRTMQSLVVSPGNPPRNDDQLRRYLRRWLGTAITAQAEIGIRA